MLSKCCELPGTSTTKKVLCLASGGENNLRRFTRIGKRKGVWYFPVSLPEIIRNIYI